MNKKELQKRRLKRKKRLRNRKIFLGIFYTILAIAFGFVIVHFVVSPLINLTKSKNKATISADKIKDESLDKNAAKIVPILSLGDPNKVPLNAGWHDSKTGRWYQNPDGSCFIDGIATIGKKEYGFDKKGNLITGWLEKDDDDYFFDKDGTYIPSKKKPMLCLTFDDGPAKYTKELLKVLKENNAHATFFMLGQQVEEFKDDVKQMVRQGCQIGNHSWDHKDMFTLSLDEVKSEFDKTNEILKQVTGQEPLIARAPYGNVNRSIIDVVNMPFISWSLDSEDWKLRDVQLDYDKVMQGDLTDGSIILMHDIHEPSVKAAIRFIPELKKKGYKLVTISEMAKAKDVKLKPAVYTTFWHSQLVSGNVPGYQGKTEENTQEEQQQAPEGSGESGGGE